MRKTEQFALIRPSPLGTKALTHVFERTRLARSNVQPILQDTLIFGTKHKNAKIHTVLRRRYSFRERGLHFYDTSCRSDFNFSKWASRHQQAKQEIWSLYPLVVLIRERGNRMSRDQPDENSAVRPTDDKDSQARRMRKPPHNMNLLNNVAFVYLIQSSR